MIVLIKKNKRGRRMIYVMQINREYENTFCIECFNTKDDAIEYVAQSGLPLNEFKFIEGEPKIVSLI